MNLLTTFLNAFQATGDKAMNQEFLNTICCLIDYGRTRNDGGHDHRYNRGKDRTAAQRKADERRRK